MLSLQSFSSISRSGRPQLRAVASILPLPAHRVLLWEYALSPAVPLVEDTSQQMEPARTSPVSQPSTVLAEKL